MPLLALPLELLRQILESLASERAYIEETLEARCVNVLFSQEIFRALARTRALYQPTPNAWEVEHRRNDPNREMDIYYNPATQLQHRNKDFTVKYLTAADRYNRKDPIGTLGLVLDALAKMAMDKSQDEDQLRASYTTRLYDLSWGKWILCSELGLRISDPSTVIEHIAPHLIAAAIGLGIPNVFIRNLIKSTDLTVKSEYQIWGNPLSAALTAGNVEMARLLLESHDFADGDEAYIFRAVEGQRPSETVHLLLEPQFLHIAFNGDTGYDRIGSYEDAAAQTLENGMPDLCMKMYESHRPIAGKEYKCRRPYLIALVIRAACSVGNLPILQKCVEDGGNVDEFMDDHICMPDTDDPPRSSLVEISAWRGDEKMLQYLLDQGANPFGGGWAKYLKGVDPKRKKLSTSIARSMQACLWGGHLGPARMLLNAGVLLPSWAWEGLLDIAAQHPHAVPVLELLLSTNSIVPRKWNDLYPTQKPAFTQLWYMCEAARVGNMDFIWLLSRYGVPVDDENEYEYEHVEYLPPPIVIAKAWSQHETVKLLKFLGAKDVDPLESSWKSKFESGMLPLKPPISTECPMPWDVSVDYKNYEWKRPSDAQLLSLREVVGLHRRNDLGKKGFGQWYIDPAKSKRRTINSFADLYD
ncbi:hypothetical protein P154DRAFT_581596 [Amniculicola lignicola CBS 123094]|uniref:F-box domain-containing protein n=1 Tax=Amniculicola lignicola CBS 123094 TaxID=1392246 RepID=A0A6A5W0E6_9PLEO|nr:hypothetical protein P154DRAFT_581596 [Amniculicola lignicola CBS 123094]